MSRSDGAPSSGPAKRSIWFRQDADFLDDPRAAQLVLSAGASGVSALMVMMAWCARKNADHLPHSVALTEIGRLRLTPAKATTLIASIVEAGYFDGDEATGYMLVDTTSIRAPKPTTGNAVRCRRARERKNSANIKKDTVSRHGADMGRDMGEACRGHVGGMSPPVSEAVPPSQTLPPCTGTYTRTNTSPETNPPTPPDRGEPSGSDETLTDAPESTGPLSLACPVLPTPEPATEVAAPASVPPPPPSSEGGPSRSPEAKGQTGALFDDLPPTDAPAAAVASGKKRKAKPALAKHDPTMPEGQVFDHWASVLHGRRRPAYTPDREARIRARLAENFSVADLCKAVDGVVFNDFFMGRSEDSKAGGYLDVSHVFKDAPRVEELMRLAELRDPKHKPAPAPKPTPSLAYEQKRQARLASVSHLVPESREEQIAMVRFRSAVGRLPTSEEIARVVAGEDPVAVARLSANDETNPPAGREVSA